MKRLPAMIRATAMAAAIVAALFALAPRADKHLKLETY
jgi:hypothetical protein